MIKHSLKDDLIYISLANQDFSFRIPVKKLDKTSDWKIGEKETEGIVIKNVSTWTLQLFTKKVTESKYVKQFEQIIQEYSPNNTIDWKETHQAVILQNQYNWLTEMNTTAKKKMTDAEIILSLKKKFNLD